MVAGIYVGEHLDHENGAFMQSTNEQDQLDHPSLTSISSSFVWQADHQIRVSFLWIQRRYPKTDTDVDPFCTCKHHIHVKGFEDLRGPNSDMCYSIFRMVPVAMS